MTARVLAPILFNGLLVSAAACRCGDDPAEGTAAAANEGKDDPRAGEQAGGDQAEPTPIVPAEPPPVPMVRADAALPGKTKVEASLGFKLEQVANLYALAGTAVAADWGTSSESDPSATRDDDLLTAWTCTPSEAQTCAVGLSLGAPSEVTALRIFAAAGPDWRDYQAHPRPKTVRVHTDVGYAEVKLGDGATHSYVVFDAPVATRTITLEVLDTYRGGKDAVLYIGELEAFGASGPMRPPMALDPATVFVSYETEAWKAKAGGGNTVRLAFLDVFQPDGTRKRLMRGTAMFGVDGDRFALVEKLHGASCDGVDGTYILLDLHTRVPMPISEIKLAGGPIRRHHDGLGFLVESPDGDPLAMRGVAIDAKTGKVARLRPNKRKPDADNRTAWGFSDAPLLRGGEHFEHPPTGCKPGTVATDILDKTIDPKRTPSIDPNQWIVCDLDEGARAVVGRADACGGGYSLYHVDGAGTVTAAHASNKVQARGMRLAMIPGVGLVVETTEKNGGRGRLWQIDASGVAERFAGASLAVRLPAGCGECERDEWFAPDMPVEPASADDATGEGGLPAVAPEPGADSDPSPDPDPEPPAADDAPPEDRDFENGDTSE